jgi:hypothetical protein
LLFVSCQVAANVASTGIPASFKMPYFAGQLLTAAGLQEEQQYLVRMRHRQKQALHASGWKTDSAFEPSNQFDRFEASDSESS